MRRANRWLAVVLLTATGGCADGATIDPGASVPRLVTTPAVPDGPEASEERYEPDCVREPPAPLRDRSPNPRGRLTFGRVERVPSDGVFEPATLRRAVETRPNALQACFEREERREAIDLAGTATWRLSISETGAVRDVTVIANTTGSDAAASCVARVLGGFRFDPGPVGGSATFEIELAYRSPVSSPVGARSGAR